MGTRSCPSCGTPNEADARFCEGCGTALDRTCGSCGQAASATARFCRACGVSLDERATADGPTRKTVTVLFADLAGSTAFEEVVDAETARNVVGQYHDLLRVTADRHRVGVTKYIGDGFMAVWGVPEIGVDDAWNAVEAAVELQERFVDLASRVAEVHRIDLALRVAVNTGEVVVGARDADLVGDALNVAARLEAQCPHGQVVVGEETWRATRGRHRYESLGVVTVKGRSAPVAVYQWRAQLSENADAAPFVSRGDELRRIRAVFDEAVTAREARLVTVIGDPGLGKSRLASEFVSGLTGCLAIDARCAVEGTLGLAPIVDALRTRNFDTDVPAQTPERERILRDLTGMAAGVPASVEETFWALRRYVEVLGAQGPLVVVLDDIQWADSLLVDLVGHLLEWVRGVPVLLLALARPEIREGRPDLVAVGGWVTEAIRLSGLDAGATTELATHLLGGDHLPPDLLARLPSSTGGNPLFVRELVGMLVHDGVLVRSTEGWRLAIDVDAISIPPTIQALLASRLERLNAADRRLLEVASVIGIDFSPAAVSVLAGDDHREIAAGLERLRRLELAQPSGTYVGDEPVWRFHHVLIQDMAYRRLLKSDRADLHARLADYIETGGATATFESNEVMARHLEAAHGYRCDLNMRDAHTSELALRSARSYLASARRALDRDELISAGTQAARGAMLASDDPALQAELLLVGCEALLSAGDVAAGTSLVDDLERIAGDALAPWAVCYRCQLVAYTDPTRLPEVDERLQGAIDEFTRRGDMAGLAKAHRVRANARARLGRVGDCEGDLFAALIAARKCGDHRQITAALGAAPNAALWGPSPAPKAGGRCLDVVRMQRMTTAAPSLEATSLRCLAVLELLRGRPDKARSMLADARQVVADLGLRHGLMETELFAGVIELMVGDPVASEPHFRVALEGLDALGVGADAGQAAALLARSVLAQGRIGEADRYAAESERIAGHNLKTAIAWRAVRAEILSAQGQHEAAIAMACDAVAVAEDTDLVLDHADACMTLSRVLTAAGDHREAARVRHDAESLYAAKDAAFLVGRITDAPDHPTPMPARHVPNGRLRLENRASRVTDAGWRAMLGHDPDAVVSLYSPGVAYDDRRRLSGDPIEGIGALREAARRNIGQYPHVEWRTLAVRGDNLVLSWARGWDDSGNEATTLHLYQVGEDNLIEYHGRFDEDDFEAAYRELEERYYAGEAAAFAESGRSVRAWLEALWALDVEAARHVTWPDFRWLASASALKPAERSVDEFFCWLDQRSRQVASMRIWSSAIYWMSPECNITLSELHGFGANGEEYLWMKIHVCEYHDGLVASVREFEAEEEDAAFTYAESLVAGRSRRRPVSNAATRAAEVSTLREGPLESVHGFELEDEDAAFAFAESLVAQRQRRLTFGNRASELADRLMRTMEAHDVEGSAALADVDFVLDDRRRLTWERHDVRKALALLFQQFNHFDTHMLAVRGETLYLGRTQWSDDAGNEGMFLSLFELSDDGRFGRWCCFDDDDFWSAYEELEQRYYAGEGAQFATSGLATAKWVAAVGRHDLKAALRVSHPDFRWIAPPTAFKAAERTVEEMFEWMDERGRQVAAQRNWVPVLQWLSPTCAIGRGQIVAIGDDGEEYNWTFLFVGESRDGLMRRTREFDVDDEDAAFAYAESRAASRFRRLSVSNQAAEVGHRVVSAVRRGDIDTATQNYSDHLVNDDHRRLSGDPIRDPARLRLAFERIAAQFNRFEPRTLAVRGERLHLASYRWSDDGGNQSTGLVLNEIDEDGRIVYDGRFDEEDFETAYRELERRYYTGEGAPNAEAGAALTQLILAETRGDLDAAFSMFSAPGLRIESRSRSLFPSRTPEELRRSVEELGAMVQSYRIWGPSVCWLSREWMVGRHAREAVGRDGERYLWTRIYAGQIKDGLFRSLCEFDVDDEDAAFTYAEERMRAAPSRLAVRNRASETASHVMNSLHARDVDSVVAMYSDEVVHEAHRHFTGGHIMGLTAFRAAVEKLREQYSRFELQTLAVRGDRLHLAKHCWSDEAGNESHGFLLAELDDTGRVVYHCIFDEGDFDSAYRALEDRYFAGEGAQFAANGLKAVSFFEALDTLDVEAARQVCRPDFRWFTPAATLTAQERSLDEFFSWCRQRAEQVSSIKNFGSVVHWLTPTLLVAAGEVRATGTDGEQYAWTRNYVSEFRDGLLAAVRQFDDEEAAFDYAEAQVRSTGSDLAVVNRSSAVGTRVMQAMQTGDTEVLLDHFSEDYRFQDHRHLSRDPIIGKPALRTALARVLAQFTNFEFGTVAVRGDGLSLGWSRWSDGAGNTTSHLHILELDDGGLIARDIRFDADDFAGAYRELERRYYAGEGSAFATYGELMADYVAVMNRGDFQAMFGHFTSPDLRVENRSDSGFPDRSAAELRASLEELQHMVGSVRSWFSTLRWASPTVAVGRLDRQGTGDDGEHYAWARILVIRCRDGRLAAICEFNADDGAAAFAYAEEFAGQT